MDNPVHIETERYRLRVLRPEDVTADYGEWINNPETSEFIEASSRQHTIEDLKIYVEEKLAAPDCVMFGIFDRHSGTHVGNIKYEPLDLADRSAVMGVLIGNPSHRGVGAWRGVCRDNRLAGRRIQDPENSAGCGHQQCRRCPCL